MALKDHDWNHIYESHTGEDNYHLVRDFYVPALRNSERYDRITGYFSTAILNIASRGIEELFDNEGKMRLITGVLEKKDKQILSETVLEDVLLEELDEPITETEEARFSLIAELLDEGDLEIKVAEPKEGNWGIFHPKLGIFVDGEDRLAFEGSINETGGAWLLNYERFKVHRSWEEGEEKYVETDEETFEALWNDEHPYVDVYDLPEAIEEEIVQWKYSTDHETEKQVDKLRETREKGVTDVTEVTKAEILGDGGLAPGGVHVAEEASTIEPWPHQRVVSDTAINTYPNGFLFCDEVGLGKTIEAGLTLSRLINSGEIQNSLILPPAGLVRQWQEELWEKFNINAYRYDRGTGNKMTFTDALGNEYNPPNERDAPSEDWAKSPIWRFLHEKDEPTVVIMSAHTALRKPHWDKLIPSQVRTRDKYPNTTRGNETEGREGVWDVVIVDEAHHAREGTNLLDLLRELRKHTHCYYLLTATPMQIRTQELYDLLSMLGIPEEWSEEENFTNFFETSGALQDVIDEIEVETEDGVGQETLTGDYQSTLKPDSTSEVIFTELANELELKGGQQEAKDRILTACKLCRSYGREYDDYSEKLREQVLTEISMSNEGLMEDLLQTESEAFGVVSENDREKAIDDLELECWKKLPKVFSWATPIHAHLFRNTRQTLHKYQKIGLLDENVPERDPESKTIPLDDETEELYNKIEEYISKFYKESMEMESGEARAIGFVMTTYRQRLTSSIYAISQSLNGRLDRLKEKRKAIERGQRDETDNLKQAVLESMEDITDVAGWEDGGEDELGMDITTEFVTGDTEEGLRILEKEIEELESFIQEVRLVQEEPKIDELYDDIQRLHDEARDRVIVFTQYKDTMKAIRRKLIGNFGTKVASYSSDGGEMYDPSTGEWNIVSKERVKRSFTDEGGVEILVCTDAASEGLNLQECGALINFDLPWNPMKVEQRIGRIDRIGQTHNPVRIINYFYEDTVETKIYDRLGDRINDFEEVVGNMQPILSGVQDSIQDITLEQGVSRRSSSADMDEALRDFEQDLEEKETEVEEQTIEVGEELEDTEPMSKKSVMEDARLDAWKSARHPDIGEPADDTYPYEPPFTAQAIKNVLSKSRLLRDAGVDMKPVDDVKDDSLEDILLEEVYIVTLPDRISTTGLRANKEEDTIAHKLAPEENKFAVTFDPECADSYPSVRYLTPKEPLYNLLLKEMTIYEGKVPAIDKIYIGDSNGETCIPVSGTPPVVIGWIDDEEGVKLTDVGTTEEADYVRENLQRWCSRFRENRSSN